MIGTSRSLPRGLVPVGPRPAGTRRYVASTNSTYSLAAPVCSPGQTALLRGTSTWRCGRLWLWSRFSSESSVRSFQGIMPSARRRGSRWRSTAIYKRLRSRSPLHRGQLEYRARRRSFLLLNFFDESAVRTPMSNKGFSVSVCPTCGGSAIRKVSGSWTGNYKGEAYTVKALEYYACPNCNEKVYPPEAMRRIQHASPAYRKSAARRAARRAHNPEPQADT